MKNQICKLILPGTIRIKKNSKRIYGHGKFKKVLPSKAYVKWEEDSRLLVERVINNSNGAGILPLNNKLHVMVRVFYKGPQMDLSGALESIGDCLEGLIWKNDKQIMSWDGSRLFHDLENPRTEITIKEFLK